MDRRHQRVAQADEFAAGQKHDNGSYRGADRPSSDLAACEGDAHRRGREALGLSPPPRVREAALAPVLLRIDRPAIELPGLRPDNGKSVRRTPQEPRVPVLV